MHLQEDSIEEQIRKLKENINALVAASEFVQADVLKKRLAAIESAAGIAASIQNVGLVPGTPNSGAVTEPQVIAPVSVRLTQMKRQLQYFTEHNMHQEAASLQKEIQELEKSGETSPNAATASTAQNTQQPAEDSSAVPQKPNLAPAYTSNFDSGISQYPAGAGPNGYPTSAGPTSYPPTSGTNENPVGAYSEYPTPAQSTAPVGPSEATAIENTASPAVSSTPTEQPPALAIAELRSRLTQMQAEMVEYAKQGMFQQAGALQKKVQELKEKISSMELVNSSTSSPAVPVGPNSEEIARLEKEMQECAENNQFTRAMELKKQINALKVAASDQPAAATLTPSASANPSQPAYQPSAAPAAPAANDNSARIAQLTAEMQECAENDQFTRAMELKKQIDELKASPATAASGVEGASQPTTSEYPPQPAYQPIETPNVVAPPAENSNGVPAPAGIGYPPQPAYQPSAAPAAPDVTAPAANDNSARIAQLTAEMQECAENDQFTRAMELKKQIDELKASPATAASGVEGASQPSTSGYPPQPAYQPVETPNVVAPPAENSNGVPAPAGIGYPPQPAYQPSAAPAAPAANDNSARIAQLTAEMQKCASSDQFTRAMELQRQIQDLQAGGGTPAASPASTVTHVPAQTPQPTVVAPTTTAATAGGDVNAEIARLNAQMQHFANNDQYIKAMEISQKIQQLKARQKKAAAPSPTPAAPQPAAGNSAKIAQLHAEMIKCANNDQYMRAMELQKEIEILKASEPTPAQSAAPPPAPALSQQSLAEWRSKLQRRQKDLDQQLLAAINAGDIGAARNTVQLQLQIMHTLGDDSGVNNEEQVKHLHQLLDAAIKSQNFLEAQKLKDQIQLLMTTAAKQSPLASKIMALRQLQTQMAVQQKYMNAGTIKGLILSLENSPLPQLQALTPPKPSGPSAAVMKRVKELEAQMEELVKREMYKEAAAVQKNIESLMAGKSETPLPPVAMAPLPQTSTDSSLVETIKTLEMKLQDLVSQQRYPEANKLNQQIQNLRAGLQKPAIPASPGAPAFQPTAGVQAVTPLSAKPVPSPSYDELKKQMHVAIANGDPVAIQIISKQLSEMQNSKQSTSTTPVVAVTYPTGISQQTPVITSPLPPPAAYNPYPVQRRPTESNTVYTPRPQPASLRNPALSNYQLNALLRKQPPLYDLAKKGDCYTLRQRLVELGPHAPNVLNTPHRQFGSTPMHGAAWFLKHEAVRLLIEFGAEINIPNRKGYTAYQESSMGHGFDRTMKAFFDSKRAYDARNGPSPQTRRPVTSHFGYAAPAPAQSWGSGMPGSPSYGPQ